MALVFFIIFTIIIFGIMLVLSLIRGVASFLSGKPASSSFSGYHQANSSRTESNRSRHDSSAESRHKVFPKEEGEYVKFEEIGE
jgi:hypothetical protein